MLSPTRRRYHILATIVILTGLVALLPSGLHLMQSSAPIIVSATHHLHQPWRTKPKCRQDIAVATFFSGETTPGDSEEEDNYFIAVRTLAYQLRHSPRTRLDPTIPFIILVTPEVRREKRKQLTDDGAVVIEVDNVKTNLTVYEPRWRNCWTKLRLFDPHVLPFERVLFMDGDTVLTRPIAGVFDDPAAQVRDTQNVAHKRKSDEAPLPTRYLFAGKPDAMTYSHSYPPDMSSNYLNAGFFVYSPSKEIMQYYMSVLELEGRFSPDMPEQNLLNYAHRVEGNMPWQKLHYSWNQNFVTPEDLKESPASLHVKYWDGSLQQDVINYALRWRWEMEGFWVGVNQSRERTLRVL